MILILKDEIEGNALHIPIIQGFNYNTNDLSIIDCKFLKNKEYKAKFHKDPIYEEDFVIVDSETYKKAKIGMDVINTYFMNAKEKHQKKFDKKMDKILK